MFEFLVIFPEIILLIIQNSLNFGNMFESLNLVADIDKIEDKEESSLFDEAAKFIGQYVLVLVIIGMVQASTGFNIMYEDLTDNQRMTAALFGLVCTHVIRNREAYIDSMLPPLDKIFEFVVGPDGSIRVATKSPFRTFYGARSPMYPDTNGDVFRMYEWKSDRYKCEIFELKGDDGPRSPSCDEYHKLYRTWRCDQRWARDYGEPSGYEHIIDIWYEIKINADPRYYRLLRFFLEDLQMFFDFSYQLF